MISLRQLPGCWCLLRGQSALSKFRTACPVLSYHAANPVRRRWRHTNPTCRVHHRLACPPKFQSQAAAAEQASHKFPDRTNQRTSSAVALQAGLPSRQVWIRSSPKKTKSQENQASPAKGKKVHGLVSFNCDSALLCSAVWGGPSSRFFGSPFSPSYQPEQNRALNLKPGMQPHHKPATSKPSNPKPLTFHNHHPVSVGSISRGTERESPNQPCITPCLISPPISPLATQDRRFARFLSFLAPPLLVAPVPFPPKPGNGQG